MTLWRDHDRETSANRIKSLDSRGCPGDCQGGASPQNYGYRPKGVSRRSTVTRRRTGTVTRRSVQEYLAAQRERIRAGPACGPQPVAGRDGHRHGLSPEGHHSSSCDRLPPARDVAAASAGPGSTTARWRARHRSSGRPRGPIGAKRRQPFVPELLERLTACGPLRVAPETAGGD